MILQKRREGETLTSSRWQRQTLPMNLNFEHRFPAYDLQPENGIIHGTSATARLNYRHASVLMAENSLVRFKFFKVRHIFIPVTYKFIIKREENNRLTWGGHASIIVTSPETRTIEHLDSISAKFGFGGRTPPDRSKPIFVNILNLLAYHLREDFKLHEWKIQRGKATQQNYATSKDCTYTAISNAMCTIFGYSLDFSEDQKTIQNRRLRIALYLARASFSEDPNSEDYYSESGKEATNDEAEGYIPIPYKVCTTLRRSGVVVSRDK
jgi:hypothetical protein